MRAVLHHPLLRQLIEQGIRDERVLAAIANVPRDAFVDEAFCSSGLGEHGVAHRVWPDDPSPILSRL